MWFNLDPYTLRAQWQQCTVNPTVYCSSRNRKNKINIYLFESKLQLQLLIFQHGCYLLLVLRMCLHMLQFCMTWLTGFEEFRSRCGKFLLLLCESKMPEAAVSESRKNLWWNPQSLLCVQSSALLYYILSIFQSLFYNRVRTVLQVTFSCIRRIDKTDSPVRNW